MSKVSNAKLTAFLSIPSRLSMHTKTVRTLRIHWKFLISTVQSLLRQSKLEIDFCINLKTSKKSEPKSLIVLTRVRPYWLKKRTREMLMLLREGKKRNLSVTKSLCKKTWKIERNLKLQSLRKKMLRIIMNARKRECKSSRITYWKNSTKRIFIMQKYRLSLLIWLINKSKR